MQALMTDSNIPAPMPISDDGLCETYAQGLIVEWFHQRQIGIYTLPNLRPKSVDEWVAVARQYAVQRAYQVDLSMHDFSRVWPPFLNAYTRRRANDLVESTRLNTGRVAIVLPDSRTLQVFQFFIEIAVKRKLRRETHLFTQRDAAFAWLVEGLKQPPNA